MVSASWNRYYFVWFVRSAKASLLLFECRQAVLTTSWLHLGIASAQIIVTSSSATLLPLSSTLILSTISPYSQSKKESEHSELLLLSLDICCSFLWCVLRGSLQGRTTAKFLWYGTSSSCRKVRWVLHLLAWHVASETAEHQTCLVFSSHLGLLFAHCLSIFIAINYRYSVKAQSLACRAIRLDGKIEKEWYFVLNSEEIYNLHGSIRAGVSINTWRSASPVTKITMSDAGAVAWRRVAQHPGTWKFELHGNKGAIIIRHSQS